MKIDFFLRYHTKYGQTLAIKLFRAGEASFQPMQFLNTEFWHASIEFDGQAKEGLNYQYVFRSEQDEEVMEGEKLRHVSLSEKNGHDLVLIDTWNYAGQIDNAFFSAPFKEVFFREKQEKRSKKNRDFSHEFRLKAPLLQKNESVCLVGNCPAMNNWEQESPLLLVKEGDWWTCRVKLEEKDFPVLYKYGVYNTKEEKFVRFEEGDNRLLQQSDLNQKFFILHDGFLRQSATTWKGAGIAIPVFSLRSKNSFGVGEFTDIKLLADWAAGTGLKLIQLLPVNDTSATFTSADSYPYAAISAFALHPIYINLEKVAGKKHAALLKETERKQKQLNKLPELDYEAVIKLKMRVLRDIFKAEGSGFMKEEDFKDFYNDNIYWLKPYAAFSYLRDKNKTAAFSTWKNYSVYNEEEIDKMATSRSKAAQEMSFYFFIQYHLHLQLKEAAAYAHKKGIALKGDIPIGIFRDSVDAWRDPELYHMNWQAGAPPDDFAVKGQNWGFPTYNWQKMQEDGFEWWRQRFHQMSNYFDAFRIDHILGFFRIWSIPLDAVEGILGRFVPALPVQIYEFGERGIWFDHDRYCKPYITDAVLEEIFADRAAYVREKFLTENSRGGYDLREEFNSQLKIEEWFAKHKEDESLKMGLFDLVTNVLFFEEPGSNGTAFHFRISIPHISSYLHLDAATKSKIYELYVDYFYRRQDEFWKKEALRKLPFLKQATDMLICGEDLGMVPHSVPDVMRDLGILSLEIQRMPKNPKTEFFLPATAPYLSVITPSTHDMSTIRGWWEESREKTQRFYNEVLGTEGEAPYFCEPWINRALVLQHLYSPAMWSVFQLQDLLGMSSELRRENPHEERINQPADPKHYWRYRMHITLEQLLREKEFNEELKDYVSKSGR